MDACLLIGGIAVVSAFACLYSAASAASASLRQRRTALAAQGEKSTAEGFFAWRLRNGFECVKPLARRLLKIKRVREFAEEALVACADKNLASTGEALMSVLIVAMLVVLIAVGVLTGSVAGAVAVALCVAVVALTMASGARDKRREAVREEVPQALESMAACFGSGFTLLQTFSQVAEDMPGRLGSLFARSAHMMETGGSAEEALGALRDGAAVPELAFVAVALDVQHQSGGTLRQVLDAASDSVKGELALRRSLRVQTAQAKLSARVVVVMPFVLVAAFSLASPDFLTPFFSSVAGYALLGLAVLMQVAGIMLVRRALSVDGVL